MSDPGFEFAPIGLVELENRIIRRCNQHFALMFGGTEGDYTGLPLMQLYPSLADFERIGAHWLEVMRETDTYADERVMRRRDGTLFWCRARGRSLT
ncbi:PAS domain-containing protein, partial [Cribrihabitans sp. XS_ASV171]